MNKKIAALCFLSCWLPILSGCSLFNIVKGDGNIVTHQIEIEEYDCIEMTAPSIVVNYSQTDQSAALKVTTDQNIYDMFNFQVCDKTLIISLKNEHKDDHPFPTQFTLTTSSKSLRNVTLTGKNELNLQDTVRIEKLKITITGRSKVHTTHLVGDTLYGIITGSGIYDLKGKVKEAHFQITGKGDVEAYGFQVDNLSCNITGLGDIQATVVNTLTATITGKGAITYQGEPAVSKQINGLGSVKKAD